MIDDRELAVSSAASRPAVLQAVKFAAAATMIGNLGEDCVSVR